MPHRPSSAPIPPADPRDWRPQRARPHRTAPAISNALVEPLWDGIHVIVHWERRSEAPPFPDATVAGPGDHVTPGSSVADDRHVLIIVDELGDEVEEAEADAGLREELRGALLATDAVIDGYLTHQATRPSELISTALVAQRGAFNPIYAPRVEVGTSSPAEVPESPLAFVAVDLLRVDGETLLDVPLLERKRLLDGALSATQRVRVSPYTQPPIDPWLSSWSAAGFRGVMLKAANSRYLPGEETDDWTATLARPGR